VFEQKQSPEAIIAAGHDADLVYEILNRVESPANGIQTPAVAADVDHFA